MSHLIGSGRVDSALVGVQNYRRRLLVLFADFLFKDVKGNDNKAWYCRYGKGRVR